MTILPPKKLPYNWNKNKKSSDFRILLTPFDCLFFIFLPILMQFSAKLSSLYAIKIYVAILL
jgi:hypothetical protein